MSVWEEIVDYTVPSNTTSGDFTGLNITKDDFIKIYITFYNGPDGGNSIRIYANDNTNDSNYYRQYLIGDGSSILSGRVNNNSIASSGANEVSTSLSYLKVSENDKLNAFSNQVYDIGSSLQNRFQYQTSTSSFTGGITKLTFTSARTNHFEANSRIQIYRLTAEKVADITVSSNTTQVDITGLNITKDSEYLLVSDIIKGTSGTSVLNLLVNDNTTETDYYMQRIIGDGSSVIANRQNRPFLINVFDDNRHMSYAHIKLSNIGAYTAQSYTIVNSGTSSITARNHFISSLAENITSINKLNIRSNVSNGIGSGTRFELYKLY